LKKLILGTVQLNNKYGILGSKKKTKSEIYRFLEYCINNKIKSYDTAEGYNNHKILGEFFKCNKFSFTPTIYTKVGSITKKHYNEDRTIISFKKKIEKIIKDLSIIPDTLFFHDVRDNFFFNKNFKLLKKITLNYGIKNIGSSIYNIEDLDNLSHLSNITIQIPLSPANLEFKNKLKKNHKVIARSIFLQGLLTNLKIQRVPKIIKKSYYNYVTYIIKNKINPLDFCLNFINTQKIDKFIVGVDNIDQLKKIIKFKRQKINYKHVKNINSFFSKNESDPRLWQ